MFNYMDVDRNGMLTYEELRRGTRANLHVPEKVVTDADLHSLFRMIDTDRSGYITFKEFMAYIKHGDHEEYIRMEALKLKRLNESRRALQIAIAKSGLKNNPDQIVNVFRRYDEDFSGTLSSSEFKNALRATLVSKSWDLSDQQIGHLFDTLAKGKGRLTMDDFVHFLVDGKVEGIQSEVAAGNTVKKVNKRPAVPVMYGGVQMPPCRSRPDYRYAKWLSQSTPSLSSNFLSTTYGTAPRSRAAASKMSPSSSGWITQDIHDWDPDRPLYTR